MGKKIGTDEDSPGIARAPNAPSWSDPSANVLKMVEKAIERMDDLRDAEAKRNDDIRGIKEGCDKETAELREQLAKAESKRIDALNLAESRRIDAVLQEMKAAVALASEKTTAGASQLAQSVLAAAATTAASVENLRANNASSLESQRTALDARLARLEQQQYQTGGRDIQRVEERGQSNTNRAAVIGVAAICIGQIVTIILFLSKP